MLLIVAIFDIEIIIFWISSEENIIADMTSRYNFKKLADLGFQDQINAIQNLSLMSKMSILLQKLTSFYKMQSFHWLDECTILYNNSTSITIDNIDISLFLHSSRSSHIDSQKSCAESNLQRRKSISIHFIQFISKTITKQIYSKTLESNSLSKKENMSTKKTRNESNYLSWQTFYKTSFDIYKMIKMISISKRHSAWHLPNSYNRVNLHEIPENHYHSGNHK